MSRQWTVGTLALAALAVGASATFSLRAQQPAGHPDRPADDAAPAGRAAVSVRDALNRPFRFPFAKPTPIQDVADHLAKALQAPVALDRAALDRLGLKPDDSVQLDLDGVRLKTGLKLLLDQLDMTYKVEPDDNLLILTDTRGADDPLSEVLAQLKSLHRDVHDLQDALDELRADLGLDEEGGPRMRKPTIIEELPPEKGQKPKGEAPASSPPRPRSGA